MRIENIGPIVHKRGRKANLRDYAVELLRGSCIRRATVYRDSEHADGVKCEIVTLRPGAHYSKIAVETYAAADDSTDMPHAYRVWNAGEWLEYHGSEAGWAKFKTIWES